MQVQFKKNILVLIAGKKSLLPLLLILSVHLQGQVDTTVFDSVKTVIEEPAGDYQQPPDAELDNGNQYFLYKWQITADSFSIQLRHVSDSALKKLKEDDAFWYANAEIKKEKPELRRSNYVPLGQQRWFQTLLWLVIIGGFAAAIMWYLAGSNVGLFRRRNIQSASEDIDGISEDIFAINYQKEIDKAAVQGNFRLAIRLMFLRLLKDLSEKNIIQYKQDRTNFDYLVQLQPTDYYNGFFRITRNYEYSWYGKFQVSEQAYNIIREDFDEFNRKLR